jgi:predicted RNA-binding protein with PIN domain
MADFPHIIIDGYNYILRLSQIDPTQEDALFEARERMIRQMAAFLGQKRRCITIVFDGQDIKGVAEIRRPAGLSVVFSRAPQKADPAILALIAKSKQPRNITVVTSDHALARMAAGSGCLTMTVEEFAQKLITKQNVDEYEKKYRVQMSQKELDEWIRLFNQKKEE